MRISRASVPAIVMLAALWASAPARADLYSAQVAYEKGDFAAAFKEFKALAELGQPLAQHNLAVMYARGEGVEISNTNAFAWATLAAENGMEGARNLAAQLEPDLSPVSLKIAHEIEQQHNREALEKRLMPRISTGIEAPDHVSCRKGSMFVPKYPADAEMRGLQGQVFVEFTVMPDGRARLPRMILSLPPETFDKAARQSILRSTFIPATVGGKPVPCPAVFLYTFQTHNAASEYEGLDKFVSKTLKQAEAGDPRAETLYGFLLAGLPQLRKSYSDALPWFVKAAQSGMPVAQYQVGYSLLLGRGCQCEENKAADWLRKAAEADQADAQVTLARYAMRGEPGPEDESRAKVWLERAARNKSKDGIFYLAALLATSPVDDLRDPKRALELIDSVFGEFDDDPTAFEIRAAAHAGLRDYAAAAKDQEKALAKAGKLGWNVQPEAERLTRYQTQQDWLGDLLRYE